MCVSQLVQIHLQPHENPIGWNARIAGYRTDEDTPVMAAGHKLQTPERTLDEHCHGVCICISKNAT